MGVYFTELLVDELESDVPLSRRARTGILDAGDGRPAKCSAVCRVGCVRDDAPANIDVAPLPKRWWWGELYVVAGRRDGVSNSRTVSTPGFSSSVPSNTGMPNPGDVTSCPLTTSPKNGCLPPDAGLFDGDVTFLRVGDVCWSRLLLLPVVRRVEGAFRGEAGAGCGRSLGFRLLNL